MSDYSDSITDFLLESEPLIDNIDECPVEVAIELYDMLETVAYSSSENIRTIDTNIRVDVCNRLDLVLEHIVDTISLQADGQAGVFTPAVQGYRRWQNVELMKDKGLTGYMLAKELGARAYMLFCTKPEDYPYLGDLPDLHLLYSDLESGLGDVYYKHLRENYSKIDILILHGMYIETIEYLNEYRKLRPDGKVFCGLDMNSYWMGNTSWNNPVVQLFAAQCDLIATSCKSLRDELNRNRLVSFPCRYFPNGFYNPTNVEIFADPYMKENTIITVGRIGTAQKNNPELMISFAKASKVLKKWKLKFIGSIETEFLTFIDEYFAAHPDLRERVVFTGAIFDKAELYREYAKAKIFALTSTSEGAPNVFAEALFHGCKFITSDIDAADDITNSGELGIKYKRGDVEGLTKALITLCSESDVSMFEKHIPKALDYAEKYFDWKRNAKKLTYALLKPD